MLTSEIKRHIDAARQVLVGVVPNPTSQIDQITNALIYKFMDDMDQAAVKADGQPSFFVRDLERYSWTRLMDPRVGNQERMNLYSEALIKFTEAKNLPPLFRDVFKSAFLPYRSPEVLDLFLKEINYFDYSHPEELGNAYEYLLSVMGSQGDAGQFRTPRHIIDFIVDVIDPTEEDKILDPACGTGGFLVKSYLHILEKHEGVDASGKKRRQLTPDQRKKLMNNFEGYDVDPGMVRIAQVNMFLHNFRNPKISNYNSLSDDERWNDKFDVILANPPFMSPKGGVMPHNKFSIKSNRSEVLFVDYIMNHLRPKGKAGIIVPEGIIFQSGNAHKQLRKNLIEDGLFAVVSLPSGIFNPYSGVKTSILFFDNDLAKRTKDILFIKIQYDGTDLGAKKKEIERNDIPDAIRSIYDFKNGSFTDTNIAFKVDKQLIVKNEEYNLTGDRYKKTVEFNSKYELVELSKLIEEKAERIGGNSENLNVWSVSNKEGLVLSNEYFDKKIASADVSNYKIVRPDFFAYNPSRINVGSIAYNSKSISGVVSPMYVVFVIKKTGLLSEYLFSLLKSDKVNGLILQLSQGAVRQQLRFNDLKLIRIPLPPLEIQKQIVGELGEYQKIISGARQVVENWKPKMDVNPKWRKVNLPDCVDFQEGPGILAEDFEDSGIPLIRLKGLKNNVATLEGCNFLDPAKVEKKWKHFRLEKGDLLLSTSASLGMVSEVDEKLESSIAYTGIIRFRPKNSNLNRLFLKYSLMSEDFQIQAKSMMTGVAVKHFGPSHLKKMTIFLPPIDVQKEIVGEIRDEQIVVEGNKKLIEIYEGKIERLIDKVWGS